MMPNSFHHRLEHEARLIAFSEVVDEGNREAKRMEQKQEQTDQPGEVEDKEVSKEEVNQLAESGVEQRMKKAEQDSADMKREKQETDARLKQVEAEATKTRVSVRDPQAEADARKTEKDVDAATKAAGDVVTLGAVPDHYQVDDPGEQYKQVEVGGGAVQTAQVETPTGESSPKAQTSSTNAEQAKSETLAADTSAAQQVENQQRGPQASTPEKQRTA